MSKLIQYLEDLDVKDIGKLRSYIIDNDIDTLQSMLEYVRKLVYMDWEINDYSPFSFVPSMDLSGFGGCTEISCKMKRASNFAKFSALYCDTAYIYVPSITLPHEIKSTNKGYEQFKMELIADFSLIVFYENLITRKIIKIVPPNFNLCKDCFIKDFLTENDKIALFELSKALSKKASIVAREYSRELKIGLLEIKNLEEIYMDHKSFFGISDGPFLEELKNLNNFPTEIKDKKLIESFVYKLVEEEYYHTKFETFMSSAYKSKYITAKTSGKMIIDAVSNKKEINQNEIVPIYDMPIVDSVNTNIILSVRDREAESFNQYRVALNKAINEHYKGQSEAEITEIYDDIVYPSFTKLESSLKQISRKNIAKTAGEIAIIGSTLTLGIIGGIIPFNSTGILAGLSGTTVISNIVKKAADWVADTTSAPENDYYFLWKLKNKR